MVIAGIVIVVATFIAIIKQFETRLVLLLSGLLMCFIGGQLGAGTTAFVKELTNPGLVPTICTVLGFSYGIYKMHRAYGVFHLCRPQEDD